EEGELLEPADELVRRRPGLARGLERELGEVGEPAPVAALAEVIAVAGQGLLVARVDREHAVEVLGGAVAVAELLAGDGGELEEVGDEPRRVGLEVGQATLEEGGVERPVLVLGVEPAEAVDERRRVGDDRGELLEGALDDLAVLEVALVELDPAGEQGGALLVVEGEREPVAVE